MAKIPKISELYDLSHTAAASLLGGLTYPWEVLPHIGEFVRAYGKTLDPTEYREQSPEVFVHKTVKIASTATLCGPCVIGAGTEIRPGAYIRGSVLVGRDCVIGNSTELKNAILFDSVQVPHYNYVGDSVLGYLSHMGAGAIASNIRSDRKNIVIHGDDEQESGLRKIGTMLGDRVEIGCNSVLCPGSIVGRDAVVYPLSRVRGIIPERTIYKGSGEPVPKKEA